MAIRRKSEEIQQFIIDNVTMHPKDIGKLTATQFDISRAAVAKHLQSLHARGLLETKGETKAREYSLIAQVSQSFLVPVSQQLDESMIWRDMVNPLLANVKENVRTICNYGFTEMLDNVKDHSGSKEAYITVQINAAEIMLIVADGGVGVFNKLMKDFGLSDPRHALLELCKGKLTSDPSRHSGQGIFFTSRMFDDYLIWSGDLAFARANKLGDWLVENRRQRPGTLVMMTISARATQTAGEVVKEYSAEFHDLGFTRTHIPIELARYEGEQLVSRSQARRLMARVDKFKEVVLDFKGVSTIGQAFADEIFRVYRNMNPLVHIVYMNANQEVENMVRRAIYDFVEEPQQTTNGQQTSLNLTPVA